MTYKGDYNPREGITKTFEFPLVNVSDKSDTNYYFHSEYEFAGQDAPDALTVEISQRLVVNRNGATRDIDYGFYRSHPYNTPSYSAGNVYSTNKVRDYGVKILREGDFKIDLLTADVYQKTHEWQTLSVLFNTYAVGDVGPTSSIPYDFRSVKLYDSGSVIDNIAIHVMVPPKNSYEISFDANGGAQEQCPDPLTKWHDEALAMPECVMSSAIGVFVGWSLSAGGEVAFPGGVIPASVNEPLVLYAIWDSGHYGFSLDPCGGIGDTSESEREVGVSYLLEPCPYTRPGYDFRGWSTTAGGEPEYPDGGVFCMEAQSYRPSITLYACWERGAPKITALACDRSGSESATVAVGFSLYHAQDFDPEDAPTATVTVTASPRPSGSEGADVVQVFPGISEPEALLEMEGLETALAYGIQVDVSDDIDPSLSDTRYSIVGTGEYTLDFAPGGKGMGVFMKCPKGEDGRGQGVHVSAEDGFSIYGLEGYGDKTLQDLLEEVKREAKREAALAAHPIGSYFWSDDPKDPGEIFGGTWKAVTDRFLYAAGEKGPGDTGGEKAVKLELSEIPPHDHPFTGKALDNHSHPVSATEPSGHNHGPTGSSKRIIGTAAESGNVTGRKNSANSSGDKYTVAAADQVYYMQHVSTEKVTVSGTASGASAGTPSGTVGSVGGGVAHDNMPPFIVAYLWRRVA